VGRGGRVEASGNGLLLLDETLAVSRNRTRVGGDGCRARGEQRERKRGEREKGWEGGKGTVNKFMGKVKSIASSAVRCVLPRAHLFFFFLLCRPSRHPSHAGCALHSPPSPRALSRPARARFFSFALPTANWVRLGARSNIGKSSPALAGRVGGKGVGGLISRALPPASARCAQRMRRAAKDPAIEFSGARARLPPPFFPRNLLSLIR